MLETLHRPNLKHMAGHHKQQRCKIMPLCHRARLGKILFENCTFKRGFWEVNLPFKAGCHEKISGVRGAVRGLTFFFLSSGDALNKTSLLTKWFAVSFSKLNHKHGRQGKICPLYKPVSVHSFEGICIPAKLFVASAVECFRKKGKRLF